MLARGVKRDATVKTKSNSQKCVEAGGATAAKGVNVQLVVQKKKKKKKKQKPFSNNDSKELENIASGKSENRFLLPVGAYSAIPPAFAQELKMVSPS